MSIRNLDTGAMLTKQEAPIEIRKADGEKGELEGYASKFWEVDSYLEATAPGAFTKSITDRGPKSKTANRIHLRYEHIVTCGKHTAMEEDETGLLITAFISDDGLDGTRLRRHLQDGIAYGLSIGFRRVRSRPATADDPLDISNVPPFLLENFDPAMVTILTEAKLMENSAVSFPSVDSALITNYRSLGIETIDQLLKALKAGTIEPSQKAHLERLAIELPAALAPATEPPKEADSVDLDMAVIELEAALATLPPDWRAA